MLHEGPPEEKPTNPEEIESLGQEILEVGSLARHILEALDPLPLNPASPDPDRAAAHHPQAAPPDAPGE